MSQIMEAFNVTTYADSESYRSTVRFGISFFNSDVTIAGPFGWTTKSNISQINTFKYYNSTNKVSYIDNALRSAVDQFTTTNRLARKVIVLMTQNVLYNSTYANDFKSQGYIINVYSLQDPVSPPKTINIQNLASPGYFTNSITNTPADLQALQAKANCFCYTPYGYDSFTSDNVTGFPTGGCYAKPIPPTGSYTYGVSLCKTFYTGTIATDKTQQKSSFLDKENNSTSTYYIGLKWSDTYSVWMWEDGTQLSDGEFNLFPNNVIPTPTGNNTCVYQDPTKNQWAPTVCNISRKYFCEFAPCDTDNNDNCFHD